MSWFEVFFSFRGRLGRGRFAVAALVLAAGFVLADQLARRYEVAGFTLAALLLFPALAVTVKRLHDRARTAWWAAAPVLAAPAAILAAGAARVGGAGVEMVRHAAVFAFVLVLAAVLVIAVVELAGRASDPRFTRFGPPPGA